MTEETQDSPNSGTGTVEIDQKATHSKEPACPVVTQMPKKRQKDNFERDIVNILKSNVQPQSYNPDEMFSLPQLPVIKVMSIPQKMNFQIKIALKYL